jgi:hypothetical protein
VAAWRPEATATAVTARVWLDCTPPMETLGFCCLLVILFYFDDGDGKEERSKIKEIG